MTTVPQFETKRILNEGTREPFVARLWVGMMGLREQAINLRGGHAEKRTERRKEFDARYIPALEALQTCREAAREVVSLLAAHRSRLAAGDIVDRSGNFVTFTETIDRDLHQATTSLLVNGVIAMSRAQNVAALFDLHIGSFFEKLSRFDQGMLKLRTKGHVELEQYFREARTKWAECFRQRRVDFEHDGWTLPKAKYLVAAESIDLLEPSVCDLPVSEFAPLSVRRLLAFVETVIAYALKCAIKTVVPDTMATVVEIPLERRDPMMPQRFAFLPPNAPSAEWFPRYDDNDFVSGVAAPQNEGA